MARITRPARAAVKRRNQLKEEFWPDLMPWRGPDETGYFCAPRSLPLVLRALGEKAVSGDKNPAPVYVELLSRHLGQGVIEMSHEEDHAFASGYSTGRATRTWKDRMKVLEDAGFIRFSSGGLRKYGLVFMVHPSIAMKQLHDDGKINDQLWEAYRTRQIESLEPSVEELLGKAESIDT